MRASERASASRHGTRVGRACVLSGVVGNILSFRIFARPSPPIPFCSALTASCSIAAAARAIKALDNEIEKIEDAIRGKERWETVRLVRQDLLHQADEATQATETVVTSKLVGAEKERAHLELLLARRRILSGL